jgi:non-ribosomal peptide synthetase-like protein
MSLIGTRILQPLPGTAPVSPPRLHHLFERQCDARPGSPALQCDSEELTYDELDRRANQWARHLIEAGVRPDDRVGILLERSVHTYVTLLAVLKCGAAFVPLDPAFPPDRIAFITEDADLRLLVTSAELARATTGVCCSVLLADVEAPAAAQQPETRLTRANHGDSLCYIIYTSGSTGRPKGVAVNHSNICNFLSVCTPIYDVAATDRVYQGMTVAFDFSIEEIWPTFVAGATLVAGPTDHRRLGPGLADFLIEQQITVLYCVPTLLATLDRDVPSLRVVNVGGEACPHELVRRWARPGRRMLNTYGPTETTVTATWAELTPDRPVTIGRPLPTYRVYLLDESLQRVPDGEAGEICVSGPGVAQGYVNRPDLTAERFPLDPYADELGGSQRLYRTGDLGRLTLHREIEFLGRIDAQVKIRGYRIELSEIEAVLQQSEEVASAVVHVHTGEVGVPELAAYVTPRTPELAAEEMRERLFALVSGQVPAYMVPAFIEVVDEIPKLASGKADRARLPAPASPRLGALPGVIVPPDTPVEAVLAAAWAAVFGVPAISVEADFFRDLGGDSLRAALVVSQLRQREDMRSLGIGDLYAHPTVRALARHREGQTGPAMARPSRTPLLHGTWRVLACGAAQLVLLYLLLALFAAPYALQLPAVGGGLSLPLLAMGLVAFPITLLLRLLAPILVKWLLIGRFRPGRYPLWGWYYCRWWLMRKVMALAPLGYLSGSPLASLYLRMLGARVGAGCFIGTPRIDMPDLLEIGDGACIGYAAALEPFVVEDGWLELAPVRIGAGAFVGSNAVVMLGGSVGRHARVAEQSLVARNQTIPDGETWVGSPSARALRSDPMLDEMAARQKATQTDRGPLLWIGYALGFLALETLPLVIFLPGLLLILTASEGNLASALALAPVAGLVHVFTACAVIAAGKWLVMRSVQPGIHPIHSTFGLRKWLADKLMATSLGMTYTLYSTLYVIPWLRLLGARVGARAEVSTVSHIDPDLLTLGAECFVADIAAVGPARYANGMVALAPTELGTRCFVGNAALVPCGRRLADGSLIGAHSVPPDQPLAAGSSWLGSPAIFLPRRQESPNFGEARTFRPSPRLIAGRLSVEFFRVVLPPTLLYAAVVLLAALSVRLAREMPPLLLAALMPALYFATALSLVGIVVVLKWLLVGRYRPRVEPLWSHFVWRTELTTGLYESVAVPWLLAWLAGTPWLPPLLRLFGARMGRRVYLDTTWLTEFDLVRVGDDAMIGAWTSLQTHLFEDRVMKMSTLRIGAHATVGPRSVVLYDASIGAGCVLDALSLAMKGETLPEDSYWRGIPARRMD